MNEAYTLTAWLRICAIMLWMPVFAFLCMPAFLATIAIIWFVAAIGMSITALAERWL